MSQQPLSSNATAAFILPLVVFLVIGSFYPEFGEPVPSESFAEDSAGTTRLYIFLIAVQVLVATGLLFYFRKVYLEHFPPKISWLSVLVGMAGVVLWIEVCGLNLERQALELIGAGNWLGSRPAFNPYENIPHEGYRAVFLCLRFALLALLVPMVEELFLRGWLVRWVHDPDWEPVKLSGLSWMAMLTPSIYGVLTHPAEMLAAILWFGLVTWLMCRTGNLWDCVVAHAVTNLLLGIYVVQFSAWELW